MSKKIVILYSGGLDSFAMRTLANEKNKEDEIILSFFDLGQAYVEKEKAALPDSVEIRTVDWIKEDFELKGKADSNSGNIIIPGRNSTLANLAASIYCPDEIWMGALVGEMHEGSTDKNRVFLEITNNAFRYIYSPFERIPKVVFPLADMKFSKLDVVGYLLDNGVTEEEILATSSCLSDSRIPCGECVVCARRKGIFAFYGFGEKYQTDPFKSKDNARMIHTMLKYLAGYDQTCHYDEHRRKEIIPAVMMDGKFESYKEAYSFYESVINLNN